MRNAGKTLAKIAGALTKRSVPTKTGRSSRWTHQAVARILSRRGPSRSDESIVHQYDTEAEIAAMARQNGQQSALRAMGVKIRSPFPAIRPEQQRKLTCCNAWDASHQSRFWVKTKSHRLRRLHCLEICVCWCL